MSSIHFHDPIWLAAGALVVSVLVVLLVRAEALRTKALRRLAGTALRIPRGAPSSLRRRSRIVVLALAVAMGFVALARPEVGMRWETVQRKGTDLLVVVDTSKSMAADDVKPTRLERVKLAIKDLVVRFPQDRIGLVAFAGDAFVESPMTLDHAALLETVDALDPGIVARGGTDISRAIDVAHEALASEPSRQKSMVLVTDGEALEGSPVDAAKRAAADGITIDTIGVGTKEGELVPAFDERGRSSGVAHDEAGHPVRSKLDEGTLQAIASATGGSYRPLGADGRGLDRLYDEVLASREKVEASSRTHRVYEERFMIPLALGLGFLLLDALLALPSRKRRGLATAVAAVALLGAPHVAHASPAEAHAAYGAGHYDDAAKKYAAESDKHPDDPRLAYNAGTAAYGAHDYAAAKAALEKALAKADPALKGNILYNLGDALYRDGEGVRATDREKTKAQWKAAIDAYEKALRVNPKDADATFNRDFVKRKLAELEAEPPPQPKNDPKDQKGQGKDGKSQNGQSQNSNNQQAQNPNGQNPQGQNPNGQNPNGQNPNGQNPNGQNPNSQNPNGQNPNGQNPNGQKGQAGDQKGDGAQAGHLDAKDARALLDSLRGDERRRLSSGSDAGAPETPTNGKDW